MTEELKQQNEDSKALYEIRFSNTLFDIMYALFIRSLSGLSFILIIGIVAFSCYFQIFRRVGFEDPLALAIYITRYVCIFFAILLGYNIVWTIYLNFSGKLKGIIGEHFFYFYENEFVEKTPFNRSVFKYSALTFYNTFGYFFIINKTVSAGYFIVPKRKMSRESKDFIVKNMSGGKPKTLILPFAAIATVFVAFVFFQTALNIQKYTITVTHIPFSITSGNDEIFVITGKHMFRTSYRYGALLGLDNSQNKEPVEDPSKNLRQENRVYVVSEKGVSEMNIPEGTIIQRILVHEGNTYIISFSPGESSRTPKISKWVNGEIVDYSEMNYKEFSRRIFESNADDEESEVEEKKGNYFSEYEFDNKAGEKGFVEIMAGETVYKLFLKKWEWTGESSGKYMLSGEWAGGRKDVFADFQIGQFKVTKKEHDDFIINK